MSVDYSAFDSFCRVATWNTTHPLDRRRFMNALSTVVEEPDFSPDEMANYIRANCADPMWGLEDGEMEQVLDRLVREAESVREYLLAMRHRPN